LGTAVPIREPDPPATITAYFFIPFLIEGFRDFEIC